jgi:transcription initiation factor IIE alpha subunit
MSKGLRDEILFLLEEHAKTGSQYFKGDKEIAERLGHPVDEIQRQMDILESQELITSANSRDGNSARINPRGLLTWIIHGLWVKKGSHRA